MSSLLEFPPALYESVTLGMQESVLMKPFLCSPPWRNVCATGAQHYATPWLRDSTPSFWLADQACCPSVITAWLCRRRMVRAIPLFLSNKPTQRHVRHRRLCVALSGYWTHSYNTELVSTVPKDAVYCTFQYTAWQRYLYLWGPEERLQGKFNVVGTSPVSAACNVRSATTRVTLSRFENRCGACQEIMTEGQQILGHHYQSNELTPSM